MTDRAEASGPERSGDAATPSWGAPERRGSARLLWALVGVTVAALLLFRFWDRLAAPFRAQPIAAFVALLPEGEGVARDGPHRLAAGVPFRLFAVLEARTVGGGSVWYTEAPALRLGERVVPGDRRRRWPQRGRLARVRWCTVEGFAPYLAVGDESDLERFRLVETFHPEWGSGWSVAGVVDPRNVQLDAGSPLRPLPFGAQRWQVRIELFAERSAITPAERTSSPGGSEALADAGAGTALVAALPPPLARLSSVFGLTQVEAEPGAAAAVAARLDEWRRRGLAFERAALLREHVEGAGGDPAALAWRAFDVDRAAPVWSATAGAAGVAAGDLVQGGGRIVVLFRDAGEPGRLDRADLVLDFHKGAKVRRLDEVFRAEGGLELEWAPLGRAAPGA